MKKIFSVILAVAVAVCALAAFVCLASDYMLGDIDGDGAVNGKDANVLKRYIAGALGLNDERTADINEDGTVNGNDSNLLMRVLAGEYIIGGGDAPDAPGGDTCDHELVKFEEKAATCEENGNIAYWYCNMCEKFFANAEGDSEITEEELLIPATGHTYSEKWTYNDTYHWHEAVCEHKEKVDEYVEHSFVDHVCTVCDAVETVTVTFLDYAGSVIEMQQVPYGGAAIAPSNVPEYTGYAFDNKWSHSFDVVIEDMTITAQYVRAYTVTFVDYDGSILSQEIVKHGDSATGYEFKETDLSPDGYERTGWDKSFDDITEDLTVRATYEKIKYTVDFYMPDGSLIETQEVEHGADAEEPIYNEWYFDWNTSIAYGFSGWDGEMKNIQSDTAIYALYDDKFDQPVIAIDTTESSASIKMYSPTNCYLYAVDFGFDWSGLIAIVDCSKNTASVLNDGSLNFDYNNKYKYFHYTWTNANGVLLPSGGFVTVVNISFDIDSGDKVTKEALEVFSDCMLVFGSEPKAALSDLETITPIVVIR